MPTPANLVVLHGTLSSDPRPRALPSGDAIVSYEITTEIAGERVGVPVAWFSPRRPPSVRKGDAVVAIGTVRRRFFRAGAATVSRTEVVAEVVARAETRTAQRALDGLRDTLLADGASAADHGPRRGSPQARRAR